MSIRVVSALVATALAVVFGCIACGSDETSASEVDAAGSTDSSNGVDSADVLDAGDAVEPIDGSDLMPSDSNAEPAELTDGSRDEFEADDGVSTRDVDDGSIDGDFDVEVDAEPRPWRSVLYPENWTPAHTDGEGRFVHDFSYAGYRYGETELARDVSAMRFDVVAEFDADPTGSDDATAAVQAAIDAACSEGGVVVFPEGLYRIDGRLEVGASHVVLRGEGPDRSRLYFTSNEGMAYRSHLTFRGSLNHDLELWLASDADSRAFTIEVADAGDLAVGDDVAVGWVITPEFVEEHAMTGVWVAFNDTWQPFFRREVVAIDRTVTPHEITLDVPLRYPAKVRDGATLRRELGYLRECGLESLGLANAVDWEAAWAQNQVHVAEMNGVEDCWIRDVASFVSPAAPSEGSGSGAHLQSGGLIVRSSKRVTVADCHMGRAQNRGGGGNGYLFEMRQSSEILFRDSSAVEGRHNFIQNWGFGLTGVVWLRVRSAEGRAETAMDSAFFSTGYSEFHHSLATANLIDSSVFDDGWSAINRKGESTGAGHTATENVVWNATGTGVVRSFQYGWGYVIGTGPEIEVRTVPDEAPPGLEELWELLSPGTDTEPYDWVEGAGRGATLVPASLYEDQLARRTGR